MNSGKHLETENFNYIIKIYATLGRGASASVKKDFPNIKPLLLPNYVNSINLNKIYPWWISGYLALYCSFKLQIYTGWGWGKQIYYKYRHQFIFSLDMESLPIAQVIASYLGISVYIRKNNLRVDVIAQSNEEVNQIVVFFNLYPLQSYKHAQFLVWEQFVMKITRDRENDVQRSQNAISSQRFHFYLKLVNKLNNLRKLK